MTAIAAPLRPSVDKLALLDAATAALAEALRRLQDCRNAGLDMLDAADLVIDAQEQVRTVTEEHTTILSDRDALADRRAYLRRVL